MHVGRQQQGITAVVEQGGVGERAGGDDAADRTLHRPLGRARLTHLFGDHHRFTEFDQTGKVLLHRVEGHAGHLDRLPGRLPPGGQGDVEQAGRFLRIFKEQLVEIPHAIEQQGVRMLRLDAEILDHHRRMQG